MKTVAFIIVILLTLLFSGCIENQRGTDNRGRFFERPSNRTGMNISDGNFSRRLMNMTEEQIIEVIGAFGNSETIDEYCREKRIECMYYCRIIEPENKLCENLNNFRNGEVSR